MKYVNPGFPQLFQYQTMNDVAIGIDVNYENSQTGYYMNLSRSDGDIFFKVIDPVKEYHILFDMAIKQPITATNKLEEWTQIWDTFDDSNPLKRISFCYRQYKDNIYELALFTQEKTMIGNPMQVNRNDLNTIEIHLIRNVITNIEFFVNNKLRQTMIDTSLGDGVLNRFSFYCNYVSEMNLSISHIIYNDNQHRIGNERIKMIRTDMQRKVIPDGSSGTFLVTELLDNVMYKDVVSMGIVMNVENADTVPTKIIQYLNSAKIDEFTIEPNSTKYDLTLVDKDPQTNAKFIASNITNRKIVVETERLP